MITVIEKLDGKRINLFERGFLTAEFIVGPVDMKTESESVRGRPGRIVTTFDYGNRSVALILYALAADRADTIALRDELAAVIDGNEPFYIYESVTPNLYGFQLPGEIAYKNAYEQSDTYILEGKRLLIYRTGNEALRFTELTGKREIAFENYELPFWESSKTTAELNVIPKEWDVDSWAWGMGIEWDKSFSWKFTSSSFTVQNLGNELVDPRYMPFKIKLKGSFSNKVTIRNSTTGNQFEFNGSLLSSDELVLDGVDYLKNGARVASKTNYGLIKLKPGENQISITGGTVSSVEFDFRFYFK